MITTRKAKGLPLTSDEIDANFAQLDSNKANADLSNVATLPAGVVAQLKGPSESSAYQIAVASGYVGTQVQWLASLVGERGVSSTDVLINISASSYGTASCPFNVALSPIFDVNLDSANLTLEFYGATVGTPYSFVVEVTMSFSGATITWPSSVKWAYGAPPSLTATIGKIDTFVFHTVDGGLTYIGNIAGQSA